IPKDYALLVKALITIEGVAKKLYPQINMLEVAKPYVINLMKKKYSMDKLAQDFQDEVKTYSKIILDFPKNVDEIMRKIKTGLLEIKFKHEQLDNLDKSLEKASKTIARTIMFSVMILIICITLWLLSTYSISSMSAFLIIVFVFLSFSLFNFIR
ncbi:MAG: hypothetical protein KAS39_06775, partial [Actinomycetia bacterium]|nr:hypothetical protein [Actinomycetes bacterium]